MTEIVCSCNFWVFRRTLGLWLFERLIQQTCNNVNVVLKIQCFRNMMFIVECGNVFGFVLNAKGQSHRFNCHPWSSSEGAGKKLSLILFVLFSIQWNTNSKLQSLSKRSYNWISVCTQVTKVFLKESLLEKGRGSHGTRTLSLFVVYRILEKGSSNVPIKGEVFARRDLIWVMSVWVKFVYFCSFGNFCEGLFARLRLCMWNHKQVLGIS